MSQPSKISGIKKFDPFHQRRLNSGCRCTVVGRAPANGSGASMCSAAGGPGAKSASTDRKGCIANIAVLHVSWKVFCKVLYFWPLMTAELKRPVRVLVAKVGLDGHDRGAKVIATALRDAGMEVIYTGLRQTPEMVVAAALQEDVDAIGISILSGAHMTVFPKVLQLLKEKKMNDVLLTGGGIIPEEDTEALNAQGVGRLFPPGTPTKEIATYITKWVQQHRSF